MSNAPLGSRGLTAHGDCPRVTHPVSFGPLFLDELLLTPSKVREALMVRREGGGQEGERRVGGRRVLRKEDSTLPSGSYPRRRVSLLCSSGDVQMPWGRGSPCLLVA